MADEPRIIRWSDHARVKPICWALPVPTSSNHPDSGDQLAALIVTLWRRI